jgi:hypothetical protein
MTKSTFKQLKGSGSALAINRQKAYHMAIRTALRFAADLHSARSSSRRCALNLDDGVNACATFEECSKCLMNCGECLQR